MQTELLRLFDAAFAPSNRHIVPGSDDDYDDRAARNTAKVKLRERLAALEATPITDDVVERVNFALDQQAKCLAFFASAIKSGEPFTDTCEREYAGAKLAVHAARAAISAFAVPPGGTGAPSGTGSTRSAPEAPTGLRPPGDDPSRWVKCARELVAWWDTGILPDGVIRARAASPEAPWALTEGDSPRMAEREFTAALVRHFAASAIEARQGEDAQRLHAQHESAVPKADAQDTPPSPDTGE